MTDWIPVSERLPPDNLPVLVTAYDDVRRRVLRAVGYYSDISHCWFDANNSNTDDLIVLAWMPLPEPYQPQA